MKITVFDFISKANPTAAIAVTDAETRKEDIFWGTAQELIDNPDTKLFEIVEIDAYDHVLFLAVRKI